LRNVQDVEDSAQYAGQCMICMTVQDMQERAGYAGQCRILRTVQDIRDSAGYTGQFMIYRTEQDMLDSAGMQDSAKQYSASLYSTVKNNTFRDHHQMLWSSSKGLHIIL